MATVENAEKFFEKLKIRLTQKGYEPNVAERYTRSLEIVKIEGNILIAECKEEFCREYFVRHSQNMLAEVAKECWGNDIKFSLRNQPVTQTSARKKKVPAKSTASQSSFLFESNDATASAKNNLTSEKKQTEKITSGADTPVRSENIPVHSAPAVVITDDFESRGNFDSPARKLDPLFTFSTFVRGQSNQVAYSACEAVARKPGHLTNPVFIFGSTGLGKTHLLHAVGHEIQRHHTDWNILYVTSGDFMNELIASIRYNKAEAFRNKYRQCDVLLVDDIQFLENKEATQLEFFHTFNELYEKRKQIVITSDKYPKDIPNIEDRLKSRFLQGLIADIEPPGFEDRVAIIDSMAKSFNLHLSEEVIMHIANLVKSSVREIRGVLVNLNMHRQITGQIPTIDTINEHLKRMVRVHTSALDVHQIQKTVASYYGVRLNELTSSSRVQKFVIPRHVAMFLAKELLDSATTEIAESFGKKDHTTVMHAISKVKDLLEKDASTRAAINEIRRKLDQNTP